MSKSEYFPVCWPCIARLLCAEKSQCVKCVEMLHATRALVVLVRKDAERLVASADITNCKTN